MSADTIVGPVKTDKFIRRADQSTPSSECQKELQLLRVAKKKKWLPQTGEEEEEDTRQT